MNYSRNAIFTRVANAIKTEYPQAYCTSRYVAKPSTFPACYIHEIDNTRPIQNTQLDFEDVQYESVFEIQVVSNKANTAATEAYGIMALADAAFSCFTCPISLLISGISFWIFSITSQSIYLVSVSH